MATSTALASQIDAKRNELNQVNAKIEANRGKLQDTQKRQSAIANEITVNDQKIAQLQTDISNLQADLDKTDAKRRGLEADLAKVQNDLDTAQTELAIAEKKLAEKQDTYNKRLTGIYKSGGTNSLELVLDAENFVDLIQRSSLLRLVAQSDGKLVNEMRQERQAIVTKIEQIKVVKDAVDKKRKAVVAEENRMQAIKRNLAAKQNDYQAELQRQKSMLAEVEKEKNQIANEIDVLQSTSNQIAAQIRQMSRGTGISVSRGSGRLPSGRLAWPANAPVTSGFGWRFHPILGYSRMHTGIDLGVAYGTPIHAAASGTVIIAGVMGGYGNVVVIDHGGGISTLYGHNSQLLVSPGQHVSQGQVVSHSGSSGLSTGPHLHFEVRVNGNPVDPMGWL